MEADVATGNLKGGRCSGKEAESDWRSDCQLFVPKLYESVNTIHLVNSHERTTTAKNMGISPNLTRKL
jgi:hypothetical protein